MTNIQLGYQNYLENRRHNYATEDQARAELSETSRHNRVYETETNRHNLATEGETNRHNVASEGIARESNAISRQAMLNQALLQRAQARLANSNAEYNERTMNTRVTHAYVNAMNDSVNYLVNRETMGDQLFDASWKNVRNVVGTFGDVIGSVTGTLARGLPSLAGTETTRQATRRRAGEVANSRTTTNYDNRRYYTQKNYYSKKGK